MESYWLLTATIDAFRIYGGTWWWRPMSGTNLRTRQAAYNKKDTETMIEPILVFPFPFGRNVSSEMESLFNPDELAVANRCVRCVCLLFLLGTLPWTTFIATALNHGIRRPFNTFLLAAFHWLLQFDR
jgi:hypothetical protein